VEARERVEQGRLPGAIRPDQRGDGARRDVEAGGAEGDVVPVGDLEVAGDDGGFDLRMITGVPTVLQMRTTLMRSIGVVLACAGIAGATLAGCGRATTSQGGRPSIVVTTNIVGDLVRNLVGGDASVDVVMPPNADPHDFAPSARQAQSMREADLLVVNGLGFEAGLIDTVDAAEGDGATVVALTDHVPHVLTLAGDAKDPHVFTDPARMAVAVDGLADDLESAIPVLDTPAFHERVAAYVSRLRALDTEVATILEPIPPANRLLVTNHEVFAYFADRYGFEVLGTVIPSVSTLASPSGGDLAALADVIARRRVPAVFAETSSPRRLAEALAAEGADVEVVELFGESLGDRDSGGATYVDMVRTNAQRIAVALAPVPG
jgi:zinc/manganese transport system substrate-binding protein